MSNLWCTFCLLGKVVCTANKTVFFSETLMGQNRNIVSVSVSVPFIHKKLHFRIGIVILCSLCFFTIQLVLQMIHLFNERIYQHRYTNNSKKITGKYHTLPYMSFTGNEKILHVNLVLAVYTTQHILKSHFILLFQSFKAVIHPGCTHLSIIRI
jgi:hypothetical protein